ncbi:MAG: hypothetical protein JNN30_13205 [Rhodanobacteraceae bacterium]|nr:hypothetical protein [Rhodanobacteraceae bacterium]
MNILNYSLALALAVATPPTLAASGNIDQNKAAARRVYVEGLNQGIFEVV